MSNSTNFTYSFNAVNTKINNPEFKGVDFDPLLFQAGSNSFTLSPSKWVESTNAIGIVTSAGKYGGTFAHTEIALEFASWISPEFKLYLITEIKRLKVIESNQHSLSWSVQRTISKINYKIQTDSIRDNLIPKSLTKKESTIIYASEADLLNVALFGITAQQWKSKNTKAEGNIRDVATLEQLVVLSNMESINALLIQQGVPSPERILQLNQVAIMQMKSIMSVNTLKKLNNL